MEFIARIDGRGVVYVGEFGVDNKWVTSDNNSKPVTIVRNENHGQNVSVEDILRAKANHKYDGSYIFFANDNVKDNFNGEDKSPIS